MRCSLGDVAAWYSGGTPKAGEPRYYDGGNIPWAVIADVQNRPISSTAKMLTAEGAQVAGNLAPVGSVLLTMYGTIGRSALVRREMATNQAITWGVPKATVLPEFLSCLIQSNQIEIDSLGRGATQRNINRAIVRQFPILLPPLEDQQRIIDLIESLDDAIEAADGVVQKSQTVLGELSETLTKVETVTLGSLAIMRSGPSWRATDESDVSLPGFHPVLAITNTRPSGEIDLSHRRFVKGLSEKVMRLTEDSIVMIRTNGNRNRIGNVYRGDSSVLGYAVSAFQIAIEPTSSLDADFLFWVLSSPASQSLISNSASGSTGLGNVAIGWLKELEVPFPKDDSVRKEFVALCRAANDNVLASRSFAASLRTLRSELLTVLLSGEHEIPESYDELIVPDSQLEPAV